jgi:hypothetical protein
MKKKQAIILTKILFLLLLRHITTEINIFIPEFVCFEMETVALGDGYDTLSLGGIGSGNNK